MPMSVDGALLINKHAGISSFGVIETLKKFPTLPKDSRKMGHGGTLDPFATGLLIVCVGRGVKLSRYFLGSSKAYEAVLKFGETTVPGDPTAEISERSEHLPASLEALKTLAREFSSQPYLQTPPMYSAKKKDGRPLYELARLGIEIEREPKLCHLSDFIFSDYHEREARFSVACSSGTYIRTLAQDFARLLGTVGMLTRLHRTTSGSFSVTDAMTTEEISKSLAHGTSWENLSCYVPFDQLLQGYPSAEADDLQVQSLVQGKQGVLPSILEHVKESVHEGKYSNARDTVAIYCRTRLVAVAKKDQGIWGLERVFPNTPV
jgi:tRNA pseudouridine55 synthase